MYVTWVVRVLTVFGCAAVLIVVGTQDVTSPSGDSPPGPTDTGVIEPSDATVTTFDGSTDLATLLESSSDGAVVRISAAAASPIRLHAPVTIDRELTIRADDEAPFITTHGTHGAFRIASGANLRLENVELRNAAAYDEPAIENNGVLVLQDVMLRHNSSDHGPAAIKSTGSVIARGLHLESNDASHGSAGLQLIGGDALLRHLSAIDNHGHRGGVIENYARTRIEDAYFATNSASNAGAIANRGRLRVRNTAFWLNRATATDSFAGAVLSEGHLRVTNATFYANHATFGSAFVADNGRAELAHVTFNANPSRAGSDVFIGSPATLRARNSVFSGDPAPMSVDIVGDGTVESLGGNVVPRPAGLWPETPTSPPDWLGDETDRRPLPTEAPSGASGWLRVIPLGKEHPGRRAVSPEHCVDTDEQRLTYDQTYNRRPSSFRCDAGAHQSIASPDQTTAAEQHQKKRKMPAGNKPGGQFDDNAMD